MCCSLEGIEDLPQLQRAVTAELEGIEELPQLQRAATTDLEGGDKIEARTCKF